jgi:hypothetical protein
MDLRCTSYGGLAAFDGYLDMGCQNKKTYKSNINKFNLTPPALPFSYLITTWFVKHDSQGSHDSATMTPATTIAQTAIPPLLILVAALHTAPCGHSSLLFMAACTFSVNEPRTFPAGKYSQTMYHPGVEEVLQKCGEQPRVCVDFHTYGVG